MAQANDYSVHSQIVHTAGQLINLMECTHSNRANIEHVGKGSIFFSPLFISRACEIQFFLG